MRSTQFSTFHKVQDDLVLEEPTLSPDTPTPPCKHSTPTTPLLRLPLLYLIPLTMAVRVKDRVVTMAAIIRMAKATAAVAAAETLLVKATRARVASSTLPRLPSPPSTILGLGPSTCTSV
jgi:hypothetical protein